jgi:hypothetical protein
MSSGQCDAGKQQVRKAMEATSDKGMITPEHIDRMVGAMAGLYCQGSNMSGRDQLAKASQELTQGAYMGKKDVAFCMNAYSTMRKVAPTIKPKDDEEKTNIDNQMKGLISSAPNCLARAGDCGAAYKVYKEVNVMNQPQASSWPEQTFRQSFEAIVSSCKGK